MVCESSDVRKFLKKSKFQNFAELFKVKITNYNRGCTLNFKLAQTIINYIPFYSVECTLLEKHKFCVNFLFCHVTLSRDDMAHARAVKLKDA